MPPLGYTVQDRKLVIVENEAKSTPPNGPALRPILGRNSSTGALGWSQNRQRHEGARSRRSSSVRARILGKSSAALGRFTFSSVFLVILCDYPIAAIGAIRIGSLTLPTRGLTCQVSSCRKARGRAAALRGCSRQRPSSSRGWSSPRSYVRPTGTSSGTPRSPRRSARARRSPACLRAAAGAAPSHGPSRSGSAFPARLKH
jgi:hypothetical protein